MRSAWARCFTGELVNTCLTNQTAKQALTGVCREDGRRTELAQQAVPAKDTRNNHGLSRSVEAAKDIIKHRQLRSRVHCACHRLASTLATLRPDTGAWSEQLTIRCFCPPLSLTPLLPTTVESPAGSWRRSKSSAHARQTVAYQAVSNFDSATMLSRMLPLIIHAVWSQKAILDEDTSTLPRALVVSPRSPLRSVDFPHPTGPTRIANCTPLWSAMFTS